MTVFVFLNQANFRTETIKMKKRTIALVENDRVFLETRKEVLELSGYEVIPIATYQQAKSILQNQWVHLAIVDLRLEEAEGDNLGIVLLRETDPIIPKVVMTAYRRVDNAVAALRPAPENRSPAVDFIGKGAGIPYMLEVVERVFRDKVRINFNLHIEFEESLSFAGMLPDQLRSNDGQLNRLNEMEDLFRKLFFEEDHIRLSRRAARKDGALEVHVDAVSKNGVSKFKVLFGRRSSILAAVRSGSRRAVDCQETLHYSAASYKKSPLQVFVDTIPYLGPFLDLAGRLVGLIRKIPGVP